MSVALHCPQITRLHELRHDDREAREQSEQANAGVAANPPPTFVSDGRSPSRRPVVRAATTRRRVESHSRTAPDRCSSTLLRASAPATGGRLAQHPRNAEHAADHCDHRRRRRIEHRDEARLQLRHDGGRTRQNVGAEFVGEDAGQWSA